MKRFKIYLPLLVLSFLIVLATSCSSTSEDASYVDLPETVDFNYHIRPILSQNCFVCHGPDNSSRKANLRLDTKEGATMLLASGHKAIVSGSIRNSELAKRLRSDDPNLLMPPPESKKNLTERQKALIEKWIEQGAKWKQHWAFIAPEISKNVKKSDLDSPSEIIDFLITEKANALNLSPSEPADKSALIRRVSYFLTGLPPTPLELNTFLSDTSQEAYEKMVEYYLESKHFGEQWARHWMDLVRYAEHMGHEFDFPIGGAHHYRDYLIRAFNDDVPYDQFVKEHLAGDLLKEPRLNIDKSYNESVLGTAYAFLGEGKHSPVSIKQEEADRIDNIIDVTSKTFQGLTVACAKCHDHKFDPIPTTDYYAMYGMFESSRIGPKNFNVSPINNEKIAELSKLNQEINKEANELLFERIANVEDEELEMLRTYVEDSITPFYDKANMRRDLSKEFDNWIADGKAFDDGYKVNLSFIQNDSILVRIGEGIISSRGKAKGLQGTFRSPNFIIQDTFIALRAAGKGSTVRIIVDNFQLIQNPLYGNLEKKINSNYWKNYLFDLSNLIGHKAYIEILPGEYNRHHFEIEKEDYIDVKKIVTFNRRPKLADQQHESVFSNIDIETIASIPINDKAPQGNFFNYWLQYKKGLEVNDRIRSLLEKQAILTSELYDSTFVMGMSEGTEVFSPVFIRGSIDQLSEEKVPHQFLTAISENVETFEQRGSGRLEWAEAVASSDNPLTSRVMVNRIWHHLFGKGIVQSIDNFGLQGSLPTHPELLDYLALQFIEDGWSVKALIKHIVMTETFQKSTTAEAENSEKDPNNDYLHAYPVRRLNAESIRDGVLAVAGTLNDSMFGPPVPIYLTEFMNGRGKPQVSGPLDGNGRRSIYIAMRRNFLSPMMLAFDMPIPFSTFGKRNTTNVPAQSLTLMNDPLIHDQAKKWAKILVEKEHETIDLRLNDIYLSAFSRPVRKEESDAAKTLIADLNKASKREDLDIMEDLDLWADYCHIIINAKEFIHLL